MFVEKHMTISKAAELIGVTPKTIRIWDAEGKINTTRTPGNQRRISEHEIDRLLNTRVPETFNHTTLTNREMLDEVVAIFHLEGMDIPASEQADLLMHLNSNTLGDYVSQILSESRNDYVGV